MEFRLIKHRTKQVPEILLDKATDTTLSYECIRVGLYLCAHGSADVKTLVEIFGFDFGKTRGALEYWAREGLAYKVAEVHDGGQPNKESKAEVDKSYTGGFTSFMEEVRRVLGDKISGRDIGIFRDLYNLPWLPPEVLLLAIVHYSIAANTKNATYFKRVIDTWEKKGIISLDAADAFLDELYRGNKNVQEVAKLLGYSQEKPPFSYAEKAAITTWFKDYKYDTHIIQLAINIGGGEKGRSIPYLHAILRKWDAKGYRTLRDITESTEYQSIGETKFNHIAPEDDFLLNYVFTPPKTKRVGTEEDTR